VDLLNNCDKDHTFREKEVKTFLNKDKNPYAILEGVRDKLGKAYRFFVCTVFALYLHKTNASDISTHKINKRKKEKEKKGKKKRTNKLQQHKLALREKSVASNSSNLASK
jgi:IS30 family transposase